MLVHHQALQYVNRSVIHFSLEPTLQSIDRVISHIGGHGDSVIWLLERAASDFVLREATRQRTT